MAINPDTGQEEDPEIRAAQAAGLLPSPDANLFAAFGLSQPTPDPIRSIPEMTHAAPGPSIAPAPPLLDSPRTALTPPAPAMPTLDPTVARPSEAPGPSAAQAALKAALSIGPDTRVTGIDRKSKAAIRAASGKLDAVDA